MQRFNPDKKVNSYGRELTELCQGSGLQILNGRDNFSDATSKFTCFKRKGKSVVDYLIANALTASLIHNFEIKGGFRGGRTGRAPPPKIFPNKIF